VAALAFVLIGVPLVMASLMGNGTMLGPFHTDRDKSLAAGCILFLVDTTSADAVLLLQ
jgi:hypothetical protein